MRFTVLIVSAFLLATFVHAAERIGNPKVKVAAIQCSSDLGAVARNRGKLMDLVEEAAKNGAKIIVLPETAITGYLSQDLKVNWH